MQLPDGYIGTKGALKAGGEFKEFKINAQNLFFFGCRLIPRAAQAMANRFTQANSSFVYNDGGADGLTLFSADIRQAVSAAAHIASGRSVSDSIPSLRAITKEAGPPYREDGNSVQHMQIRPKLNIGPK